MAKKNNEQAVPAAVLRKDDDNAIKISHGYVEEEEVVEEVVEEFNPRKMSKLENTWAKAKKILWPIVKVLFLLEMSFIILFPLFAQLSTTFMSEADVSDPTVEYISESPTLQNYIDVIEVSSYWETLITTILLCAVVGVLTMYVSSLVGYGFSKFKFKGRGFFFAIVILTIIIPPATVMFPMFMKFRFFDIDIFGIIKLLTGWSIVEMITGDPIKMTNTVWPLILLSATGFGFRGGLFIFLMRQFYNGCPNELSEAAYVDGATVFRTYASIMHPLGKSLRVTIFLLSFSWQWTDTFYSGLFFSQSFDVMANVLQKAENLAATNDTATSVMTNTGTMLILVPLLIIFIFGQNLMAEGIERSGIVG